MARTYKRMPRSVHVPDKEDIQQYTFDHHTFTGIEQNKNVVDVDPNSFADSVNTYVDQQGLLRSRPSVKTVLGNIVGSIRVCGKLVVIKNFGTSYSAIYIYSDVNIDDLPTAVPEASFDYTSALSESPVVYGKGNYIWFFTTEAEEKSVCYKIDEKEFDETGYLYVPSINLFTNKINPDEFERPNLFTSKYKNIYTQTIAYDVSEQSYGKLLVTDDGREIISDRYIKYKVVNELEASASDLNPLMGNMAMSSAGGIVYYKLTTTSEGKTYTFYYSENGEIFTYNSSLVCALDEAVSSMKISQDGMYIVVKISGISEDKTYVKSISDSAFSLLLNDDWYDLDIVDLENYVMIISKDSEAYAKGVFRGTSFEQLIASFEIDGGLVTFRPTKPCLYKITSNGTEDVFSGVGTIEYSLRDTTSSRIINYIQGIKYNETVSSSGFDYSPYPTWSRSDDEYPQLLISAEISESVYSLIFAEITGDSPDKTVDNFRVMSYNIVTDIYGPSSSAHFHGGVSSKIPIGAFEYPFNQYPIVLSGEQTILFANTLQGVTLVDISAVATTERLYFVTILPTEYTFLGLSGGNAYYSKSGSTKLYSTFVGNLATGFRFTENIDGEATIPDIIATADFVVPAFATTSSVYLGSTNADVQTMKYGLYVDRSFDNIGTVTDIVAISSTSLLVICTDNVSVINYNEETEMFVMYRTALDIEVKPNTKAVMNYEGSACLVPTRRGIAYLTYETLVQSSDRIATYISDKCVKLYEGYNNGLQTFKYKTYIFFYNVGESRTLMFDTRNSSFWQFAFHRNIKQIMASFDALCILFDNGVLAKCDTSDAEYYDNVNGRTDFIDWSIKSQKLFFTLNRYKHISALVFTSVEDVDIPICLKFQATTYRRGEDLAPEHSFEFDVEAVRVFVKRVNYMKVNLIQYVLESEKDDAHRVPLSLSCLGIKYRVTDAVR